MRTIVSIFLITSLLFSCNSTEKKDSANEVESDNPVTQKTTEKDYSQFQEIDTDEALIATALLAAPAESRTGATVIGYNMAGEFVALIEGTNDSSFQRCQCISRIY